MQQTAAMTASDTSRLLLCRPACRIRASPSRASCNGVFARDPVLAVAVRSGWRIQVRR
jgi:hypothetical protein